MKNIIYKYPLVLAVSQEIEMPIGAEILSVQMQQKTSDVSNRNPNKAMCVWARVDTDAPREYRRFEIRGTGDAAPENGRYLATVQDGSFVWHVFEVEATP